MPNPQIHLLGSEGEQFKTYTDQRWPLGTQLVLQDGRKFRFALKSGAAAVAGDLQQAAANTANHVNLAVQAAAAAGATSIAVTTGATAVAANEYQDGYMVITTTPGNGYMYTLDAHDAVAAAGGTGTFPLRAPETVQVALTTSSVASLIHNPYRAVVIHPTSPTQVPVGVAVKPIAANEYGWLQTRGPAAVAGQGTLVLGNLVIPSTTTAGAVTPQVTGYLTPVVGWVMRVEATTLHSTIFLIIDG